MANNDHNWFNHGLVRERGRPEGRLPAQMEPGHAIPASHHQTAHRTVMGPDEDMQLADIESRGNLPALYDSPVLFFIEYVRVAYILSNFIVQL